MVRVTEGDFSYGSLNAIVYLDDYFIDKYPVTAGLYKKCVDAGECVYNGGTEIYYTYNNDKDDHPINYVNFKEATDYCKWKGKRLPTDREWEKAARGSGVTYPWGNDSPDKTRANYDNTGDADDNGTTPVGFYNGVNTLADGTQTVNSPSPYGAYDMAGNVWEWTTSLYTDSEEHRSVRGGSFHFISLDYLKSFYRNSMHSETRYFNSGFRCVQSGEDHN